MDEPPSGGVSDGLTHFYKSPWSFRYNPFTRTTVGEDV